MTEHLSPQIIRANTDIIGKLKVGSDAGAATNEGDIGCSYIDSKYGGSFGGQEVWGVGTPTDPTSAANKSYVDNKVATSSAPNEVAIATVQPTDPAVELWVDPNAVPPAGTDATWKIPTLSNGWAVYGAPWGNVVGYRKLSNGMVVIKGLLTAGTVGQGITIFTLPVGYRPTENQLFSVVGNNAFARLDVQSNGAVCANAGSNAYFSCNVTFYAEQ